MVFIARAVSMAEGPESGNQPVNYAARGRNGWRACPFCTRSRKLPRHPERYGFSAAGSRKAISDSCISGENMAFLSLARVLPVVRHLTTGRVASVGDP